MIIIEHAQPINHKYAVYLKGCQRCELPSEKHGPAHAESGEHQREARGRGKKAEGNSLSDILGIFSPVPDEKNVRLTDFPYIYLVK